MAIDWNHEMANLASIGRIYAIFWGTEPMETLKNAICRADKSGNAKAVDELTRAFQSLVKIRNHFLTGE